MGSDYEAHFLVGLLFTLGWEVPVVLGLLWVSPWELDISWPRALPAAVVPTVLTLPYLWFLGPWLAPDRWIRAAVGEPAIVLVEAYLIALIAQVPARRALVISLFANSASYLAGVWLHPFGSQG